MTIAELEAELRPIFPSYTWASTAKFAAFADSMKSRKYVAGDTTIGRDWVMFSAGWESASRHVKALAPWEVRA